MTDDDESKTPLEHTLDVFVYLPLGFMLDFPRSIPRYIERGRRQLEPGRLLGRSGGPGGFDPSKQFGRWQEQTRSTLRALGVVPGDTPTNGQRVPAAGPVESADAAEPARPAVSPPPATPGGSSGIDPAELAITDYDSLSASQVVPRLDSLGADELETLRLYEAATRGRKTILNKIALLQSS